MSETKASVGDGNLAMKNAENQPNPKTSVGPPPEAIVLPNAGGAPTQTHAEQVENRPPGPVSYSAVAAPTHGIPNAGSPQVNTSAERIEQHSKLDDGKVKPTFVQMPSAPADAARGYVYTPSTQNATLLDELAANCGIQWDQKRFIAEAIVLHFQRGKDAVYQESENKLRAVSAERDYLKQQNDSAQKWIADHQPEKDKK